MQTLSNPIYKEIAQNILTALNNTNQNHGLDLTNIYNSISIPPNISMGHLAFPCFALSKAFRKSPNQIAEDLQKNISLSPIIEEIKPIGPYLNFFFKIEELSKLIITQINSHQWFENVQNKNPLKIMVEYSQPNTHKTLHVGHMRNLCLGNAIIKINKYIGNTVIAATYPGDIGTHVAKCLWFLKYHNKDDLPKTDKGTWLGSIYTKASILLEEKLQTDEAEDIKKILTNILQELEQKEGKFYKLWQETREWSLELMRDTYKWADISFDRWYFESDVDSSSLKRAKELFNDGFFIKSDGAIGMDLSEEKLGFCMMIKSDGTGMYATKDLELAYQKFIDFGLDKSIYVVDKRQKFHFQQVFKVLEKIGFEHAVDCYHLEYDFVELPSGAMSSRKGNFYPLSELIILMKNTIIEQYLNKYKQEDLWTKEEIESTANIIADGAIKFGMLKMDPSRKIVFDMTEWLKLDGDTGPYLQYVYARINSMLEKFSYSIENENNFDFGLLTHITEKAILIKLMQFNEIILSANDQYKPSSLCTYLYELGKLFNTFYANCPIGKAKNEQLQLIRLHLSASVAKTITIGLNLLGIKVPKRM